LLFVVPGACSKSLNDDIPRAETVILELPNEHIRASGIGPTGEMLVITERRSVRIDLVNGGTESGVTHTMNAINAMAIVGPDTAYVLGRECGSVYVVGSTTHAPVIEPHQLLSDNANGRCVSLYSVEASPNGTVWIVGSHATILSNRGHEWRLERNPLTTHVDSGVPLVYGTYFWSVSAGLDKPIIVANRHLLLGAQRGWDALPAPRAGVPASCGFRAASHLGRSIVVGGGTPACLLRVRDGEWSDESAKVRSFRDGIFRGSTAGDTASVMWSVLGDIAFITADDVRVLRVDTLRPLINVHAYGNALILVGQRGDTGAVVRIPISD
jgi:hypothetical protein